MKPVKALCFDLNSTLLDGSGIHEAILRTCRDLAAVRPSLDATRLLEANTAVWQEYWPEVEDGWTFGRLDGATVSLEAWRRTLRACGCDDDALAWLARDTHRRHERETIRLFSDARELFAWLSGTKLPLALITNGASDTQRDALRALGIEQRFDAVVISGEVGVAKPTAAVFGIAVEKLAVQPEQVWHVGDSLSTDIAGAKAAGLTAVWLNRDRLPWKEGDPSQTTRLGH